MPKNTPTPESLVGDMQELSDEIIATYGDRPAPVLIGALTGVFVTIAKSAVTPERRQLLASQLQAMVDAIKEQP